MLRSGHMCASWLENMSVHRVSSCPSLSQPAAPEPLPEIPPLQLDVPPEMLERVQQQLTAEVARVREELEREYAGRMAAHEGKLAALEAAAK